MFNQKMKKNELKNEKWLPINGNENYEISNLGRVRNNYKNGNVKVLKPSTNGQQENDYLFIIINGKKHYIHHLVLKYFVGEKPAGYERDHVNSNKQDNRLSNLRYCTVAENRSHKGSAHGNSKLTEKLVMLIKILVAQGMSQKSIADIIEVSNSTISGIITGRTWTHVV